MSRAITILKNTPAIIEGYTRSILNIRTSIMVYREDNYCIKCPLSHNKDGKYTGFCDSERGGCGCNVSAKTSQNQKGCPKGFWFADWFKPDEFAKFLKETPLK